MKFSGTECSSSVGLGLLLSKIVDASFFQQVGTMFTNSCQNWSEIEETLV